MRKLIGIRLVMDADEVVGIIKVDPNFDSFDDLAKMDMLKDWQHALNRLYKKAHERFFPGLEGRKEERRLGVIKAIERLEECCAKDPEDIAGIMACVGNIIKARQHEY